MNRLPYTTIYTAVVVHDWDQPVIVNGTHINSTFADGDRIKQDMIDLLIEDDHPEWDPSRVRVVEFNWTHSDRVPDPVPGLTHPGDQKE